MKGDCVFCQIIEGKIPCEKILENKHFIAIKDANPKVEGHCLVIPKKHYRSFLKMPSKLYDDLLITAKDVVGTFSGDFNIVINDGEVAGQIVKHMHMHILPRKLDDGFKLNV